MHDVYVSPRKHMLLEIIVATYSNEAVLVSNHNTEPGHSKLAHYKIA